MTTWWNIFSCFLEVVVAGRRRIDRRRDLRDPDPQNAAMAVNDIGLQVQNRVQVLDDVFRQMFFGELPHAEILRNIALYHHEAINGSGYNGLIDQEIPIEAKIVAVADVFDALTSARPYKKAWSNDRAFMFLQSMAGTKLDNDCVAALVNRRPEVDAIQKRFKEDHIG